MGFFCKLVAQIFFGKINQFKNTYNNVKIQDICDHPFYFQTKT